MREDSCFLLWKDGALRRGSSSNGAEGHVVEARKKFMQHFYHIFEALQVEQSSGFKLQGFLPIGVKL